MMRLPLLVPSVPYRTRYTAHKGTPLVLSFPFLQVFRAVFLASSFSLGVTGKVLFLSLLKCTFEFVQQTSCPGMPAFNDVTGGMNMSATLIILSPFYLRALVPEGCASFK